MSLTNKDLTIGIEEELFLVDKNSLNLCQQWPQAFKESCEQHQQQAFVAEYLASQVEIVTQPYRELAELDANYQSLRRELHQLATQNELALMAVATHPTAQWFEQPVTESERYHTLASKLQVSSRRLLVSGMHMHVGITCKALRFYVFKQLVGFLPFFLLLSTSSPFWAGHDTGFNSYRTNVMLSLPRSGLPPDFENLEAYDDYIRTLCAQGIIDSGRELWWDIRLSSRFPTIELRIADTCTQAQTTIALAALLQSLVAFIVRTKPQAVSPTFVSQNRWSAQRFPIGETAFAPANVVTETTREQLLRLFDTLSSDAKSLGVLAHLYHLEGLLESGTSADRQRRIYRQQRAEGVSRPQALFAVKKALCAETIQSVSHQKATPVLA